MIDVPERIAQCAEHIVNDNSHGYSQYARDGDGTIEVISLTDGSKFGIHGGDYDCSEMVRVCVNCGLNKNAISWMYTGSEDYELRSAGFKRYSFGTVGVRRGDVLLRNGHTAIAVSSTKQAEAYISENGTIAGVRGDQTGGEIRFSPLSSNWLYIFRYPTTTPDITTGMIPMKFKYQFDAYTNVRDKPSTKTGKKVSWLDGGDVWEFDGVVLGDGIVWGTYIGPKSKKRLYAAIATIDFGKVVK